MKLAAIPSYFIGICSIAKNLSHFQRLSAGIAHKAVCILQSAIILLSAFLLIRLF